MSSSHISSNTARTSSHQGLNSVNVDNIDLSKFTPKEREEIESLRSTAKSRGSSHMEKDIAKAKLDALIRSKEPEAHNHKHRIAQLNEERGTDSSIFSQDETFERYEMGGHNKEHPGSKNRNQPEADFYALKRNHKAPGQKKMQARDEYLHEGVTDLRET